MLQTAVCRRRVSRQTDFDRPRPAYAAVVWAIAAERAEALERITLPAGKQQCVTLRSGPAAGLNATLAARR